MVKAFWHKAIAMTTIIKLLIAITIILYINLFG